jgi:hypothetical protein
MTIYEHILILLGDRDCPIQLGDSKFGQTLTALSDSC